MARVYVSSTYRDLKECREQVRTALRRLGHEDIAMEYYAAEDRRPLDKCLEDVASCDLYIGIFAWRYGYVPPGQDKSITELEFRKAVEENKKCLIFLLHEGAYWPTDQIEFEAVHKIRALRSELGEKYLAGFFTGKDDIQARVMEAVIKCLGPSQTAPPARRPFQAPPLPAHYVERTGAVSEVIKRLLTQAPEPTGVLVVSALHGLGGVGKTALAAAVAHNMSVRDRFKDGVLWSTLGQAPDCLSNLVSWIHALGDRDYRPTTPAAASSYLRTLLYPTASLLVLDDVWESEHALPFLAGGPGCGLLITTRRAAVADGLGGSLCSLDAMTREEAVALLKKRVEAGRGGDLLSTAELEQAARLAEETGYLPLAVDLMGALVARGYDWDGARGQLRIEHSRRGEAGRRQHHAQSKLEASLRVSLNRLRAEDREGWESFAWLGVLPDDVTLNPRMAATLWGVPEDEAGRLLNTLADDAILQRATTHFGIHDLMHEMARHLLTSPAPEGLGMSMRQAHGQLLGRYASQISGRRWDHLPDDGYIHSHLLWHFEQSDNREAVWDLLHLSDPDGSNAWYVARDQLGQSAGYVEDVLAARRRDYDSDHFSIPRQCLYALIISSLHSLAQTISPEVLLVLVRRGIWTPEKAIDCIRQMLGPRRRADALTELLSILDYLGPNSQTIRNTILNEMRRAVREAADPYAGACMLARMAHHFSGSLQTELVKEALYLVSDSIGSLKELAKLVPPAHHDNVLEIACACCQNIPDLVQRTYTLIDLVASFSCEAKRKWVGPLVGLIVWLTRDVGGSENPEPESESAELSEAEEAPPSLLTALVLSTASSSPPTESARHAKGGDDTRAELLRYCAESGIELSADLMSEVLATLPCEEDREAVHSLLRQAARPESSGPEQAGADPLDEFQKTLDQRQWSDIKRAVELVQRLPAPRGEFVKRLLDAYAWLGRERSGEVFTRAVPCLTRDERKNVASYLIATGRSSVGASCVLAETKAENAREELFESALKSAGTLPDARDREAAMLSIARICPVQFVRRALHSYQRIDDAEEQAGVMFMLAPHLRGALPSEAFDHLSDATRSGRQIITLTRMVSQLSSALKGGVLDEFIKDASRLSSEWWIVEALTLTVLKLDHKEQLNIVLNAVENITLPDLRSRIVGRIVLRLARLGHVREALSAVEAAQHRDRWGILADLSSELATDGLFPEAEEVAATIGSSEERSKARAAIALHLAARGRIEEAKSTALTFSTSHWREWIENRLAMLENAAVVPVVKGSRQASAGATTAPAEISFDLVYEAADELLRRGVGVAELREVMVAAKAKDAPGTVGAAKTFWHAKSEGKKYYLDVISEQPRHLFLSELRKAGPLLGISLAEGEAEEIISAIQEVSSWWP